jgi:type VI secretion system protein ImpK
MSKDNGNDPFAPRDATALRPRPGAGKRSASDRTPAADSRAPATAAPGRPALPGSVRDFLAAGLNPLLQAASPLLILMGRVRTMRSHADVGGLRRQTLDQIREFEDRAHTAGVANETILAARYVLCAGLDEAVLSTPWGGQSEWAGQTLLVTLHRETWGGEKFFEMLERIEGDPARHIDLMELQYVCLALGFGGKYQVAERGHARLAEIQSDLFRRIRSQRGVPAQELSLNWHGMQDRRNPIIRYVPWWVVGALALVVVTGTLIFYHLQLAELSAPIDAQLARIGLVEAPAAVATTARSAAPRLKQLLSDDIARGVLSVEERGNQSLVTLLASDLFGSGRAAVNPAYYLALQHVAHALNEVPGRVFVVGHTDDQPLRSLQYRDNFDLSRARAVEVVKLLSLAIDNPARLEPSGLGASQPRYRPESLPENRARNRRVEIIHVGEG